MSDRHNPAGGHAAPLFTFARHLLRVPPGLSAHPGLRSYEVPALARRFGELADGLPAETFPHASAQLRKVAGELMAQYGATGLTARQVAELATWTAMLAGLVTLREPEAERGAA